MRRMKKALACSLSLAMVCGMFAGCGNKKDDKKVDSPEATQAPAEGGDAEATPEATTDAWDPAVGTTGGKTFRIYCWNTEFQDRFNAYYADKMPADVKVEWVINPNEGGVYQQKLDEAIKKQDSADPDERIDMFLIEADYALKYIEQPIALDLINDVKLTDADLADQYQYTKDIVTYDGKLKGTSWQCCPQGFLYRRSMAKEVLGTDDPDQVQEYIKDWATFVQTAAKMKDNGYYKLSGYDDDFRVFANNKTQPWVNDDLKIVIDDQINQWIDQTKKYTDAGYNNKASLWSPESQAQMAKDGKVFGYFGPAWFMDFNFLSYTLDDPEGEAKVGNGGYGDWGMAKGPVGSYWGGTWLCAAKGTDNIDIVKDVLYTMTCDKETLVAITNNPKLGDFTNNKKAMEEIANSDYSYAFLGGQNHIKTLIQSADDIHISAASPYDLTMTEKLQAAMKDYFDGVATLDQAWSNFYDTVLGIHPELSK